MFGKSMDNDKIPTCPNCGKELKWIPKGKHLCRCGTTTDTDGSDLESIDYSDRRASMLERVPGMNKIFVISAIIIVIVVFLSRILFQEEWLQYEAELVSNIFGIAPDKYKEISMIFYPIIVLLVFIFYKIVTYIRANKYNKSLE